MQLLNERDDINDELRKRIHFIDFNEDRSTCSGTFTFADGTAVAAAAPNTTYTIPQCRVGYDLNQAPDMQLHNFEDSCWQQHIA